MSQSLFACFSWRALDPNSSNEDFGGNVSLATFLMLSMIYSLLAIYYSCLTAANIRIIPETAKDFEEIYSKSEPKCCSSRYNVLSWQGKFGNIYRFMMKLDMNNFVKLTLTS